jgi:hypothetical protein
VFGNPGSTKRTFLQRFPDDFLFYSSRVGYDEAPQLDYDESETPTGSARRRRRHKRQRNKVTRTH